MLAIDAATRANLELTRTLGRARRQPACRDHRHGVPERRASPRRAPRRAAHGCRDDLRRQEAVAFLIEETELRERLRKFLRTVLDIARALSRLSSRVAARATSPACATGSTRRAGSESCRRRGSCRRSSPRRRGRSALDLAIAEALGAALADELPLNRRDGGFRADGARLGPRRGTGAAAGSAPLRRGAAVRAMAETARRTYSVKHNHMLGYYVEVPQAVGEEFLRGPRKETFVHRQTKADAMRFSTVELGVTEARTPRRRTGRSRSSSASSIGCAGSSSMRGARSPRPPRRSPSSTSRPRSRSWRRWRSWKPPEGRREPRLPRGRRAPPRGRGGAQARRRAVHPERLRPLGRRPRGCRPHFDHRAQHGRQPPICARTRLSWCSRRWAPSCRRAPISGSSIGSFSGRRGRRPRPRALDLHGRDGRDRGDPEPGDRSLARHPRRDRPRHRDLRRARSPGRRSSTCTRQTAAAPSSPISTSSPASPSSPQLSNATLKVTEWEGDVVFLHEVAGRRRPLLRATGCAARGPSSHRCRSRQDHPCRARAAWTASGRSARSSTIFHSSPRRRSLLRRPPRATPSVRRSMRWTRTR